MVFCASAAATHRSMQSEKRSSRLMRCVAFLKYVDQEGEDLVRQECFYWWITFARLSLSCARSWAITLLIVWELSWTVRVCMEKSGKRLCNVLERSFPTPCSALGETQERKDTRSESRGIQLVISEVWEQQTVEWVSTDGLRSLIIWYASLSGYEALRLNSYSMVQQK